MGSLAAELAESLAQGAATERAAAAERLAQLGEAARPAAVSLVRAVADDDESLREWAAAALEGMGPPDQADLPALARLTEDGRLDVSYWALTLLGRCGRAAAPHRDSVARLVEHHAEPAVRARARWALARIDG